MMVDGVRKELGAIVLGSMVAMAVSLCLWEIWAFDEAVVTREQKMGLSVKYYAPFLVVPIVMVGDMVGRVIRRVERADHVKTS